MRAAGTGAAPGGGQHFVAAVAVHVGGAEPDFAGESAERLELDDRRREVARAVDVDEAGAAAVLGDEKFVVAVAVDIARGNGHAAVETGEREELRDRGHEGEVGDLADVERVLVEADIGLTGAGARTGDDEGGAADEGRGDADFAGEVGVGIEGATQLRGVALEDAADVEVEDLDVAAGTGPGRGDDFIEAVAVEVGAGDEHAATEAGGRRGSSRVAVSKKARDLHGCAVEQCAVAVEDPNLRAAVGAVALRGNEVADAVAVDIARGDADRTREARKCADVARRLEERLRPASGVGRIVDPQVRFGGVGEAAHAREEEAGRGQAVFEEFQPERVAVGHSFFRGGLG